MERDRSKYPINISFPVHWGEMDAFGHVNNVAYFRYFESARIAYFQKTTRPEFTTLGTTGPIVAEQNCRYRIPLVYPDQLTVFVRIADLAISEFIQEYLVWSDAHQDIAAMGRARIVYLNYKNKTKEPISKQILDSIYNIENKTFDLKDSLKNSMT